MRVVFFVVKVIFIPKIKCALCWHNVAISLHQQNETDMNAIDTMIRLGNIFSSDESYAAVLELVNDLSLEITDIVMG